MIKLTNAIPKYNVVLGYNSIHPCIKWKLLNWNMLSLMFHLFFFCLNSHLSFFTFSILCISWMQWHWALMTLLKNFREHHKRLLCKSILLDWKTMRAASASSSVVFLASTTPSSIHWMLSNDSSFRLLLQLCSESLSSSFPMSKFCHFSFLYNDQYTVLRLLSLCRDCS